MVGVLKSVLQIFFSLFVFDRLSINIETIIGITLSLIAGTMFSYLEYTDKQKKSAISMNDIDYEQQNQLHVDLSFNTQDITTDSEKSVNSSIN